MTSATKTTAQRSSQRMPHPILRGALLLGAACAMLAPSVAGADQLILVANTKANKNFKPPNKIDDKPYLCRPVEHCLPSIVPGQCISVTPGITCKVSKSNSSID